MAQAAGILPHVKEESDSVPPPPPRSGGGGGADCLKTSYALTALRQTKTKIHVANI